MKSDPYGISESFFGPLTPELPALIGRIVMLSALVETKIWYLASCVGNDTQESYARERVSENIRLTKNCMAQFQAISSSREKRFVDSTLALLDGCEEALNLRNAIVHGVWPESGVGVWKFWKPLQKKTQQNHDWIEMREISSGTLREFIERLIQLVHLAENLIADAGSFSFERDTYLKD